MSTPLESRNCNLVKKSLFKPNFSHASSIKSSFLTGSSFYHQNKKQRINWQHLGRLFVMIDVANLEKGVKRLKRKVDFKKLARFLRQGSLVEIRFYTPSFGDKAHNDFLAFLRRIGYHIISKPIKLIEGKKKANFDVEIAVDATKHFPHYDTLILFSGDSDFDYLVKELISVGKKVLVFAVKNNISKELIVSSTKYFDIKKFQKEFLK